MAPDYTGFVPSDPPGDGLALLWFNSLPQYCDPRHWPLHETLQFNRVVLSEKSWLIHGYYYRLSNMMESRLVDLPLTSHYVYLRINTLRLDEVHRSQPVVIIEVPSIRLNPSNTEKAPFSTLKVVVSPCWRQWVR